MIEIKIQFLHPTDGRILTVDVDITMTAQEAIGELITANFIPPNPQGYNLAVKGGAMILSNQSFAKANVKTDDVIRIIPATDAGGHPGNLVFQIPDSLEIGEKSRCVVRISTKELREYLLKVGLIKNETIRDIEISKVMKVSVKENALNDKLIIKPLNEGEQIIDNDTYSEWLFDVYPMSLGYTSLIMRITMLEIIKDYGEKGKDVFFLDKEVLIQKNNNISKSFGSDIHYYLNIEEVTTWNNEMKNKIIRFIAENETGTALSMLSNYLQNIDVELFNNVILLQSQWNEGKTQSLLNLIDNADWWMMQSRVNYAVLEMIKIIDVKINSVNVEELLRIVQNAKNNLSIE